jgi:hypothetical protein
MERETEGGDKKRDRGRASEMQHLQQSRSFHYTPAEIYCLPSEGGREKGSKIKEERAGCSIGNNLDHSITLLPRSMIYLLMEGGRQS